MHRGQGVRLRCFCLVIFFLVGVFGNSMEKKSAPPRDAWTEAGIEAQTAGAAFQTRPGAQWLPVDSLHGIDDFHTLLDAAGTMAQNTLRAAPFLLLPAVLVFLSGIPLAAVWRKKDLCFLRRLLYSLDGRQEEALFLRKDRA